MSQDSISSDQIAAIKIDESQAAQIYANFCRVTSTPEEVVLDLGLNLNSLAGGSAPQNVSIQQRIILTPFTAKRLASLLVATVQRYEQTFGFVETDVRKRANKEQR